MRTRRKDASQEAVLLTATSIAEVGHELETGDPERRHPLPKVEGRGLRRERPKVSLVACRVVAPSGGHGIDTAALSRTLCELAQVRRLSKLGEAGPLAASAGRDSLFNCVFGRDSIRMAMDLADSFPEVGRQTILALARLQGVRDNPRGEEEPGRILHEHRPKTDPHYARLSEHWDLPYYGAVDSTPQWVNLVAAHCARNGAAILDEPIVDRLGEEITIREALARAAEWILRRMDAPGSGAFVCVKRAQPHGIPNQVWEDSSDSYYGEDGAILDPAKPYAPVAVQGYAYDALVSASELLDGPFAKTCRDRAVGLRARTLREFWQPDLRTFALALTFDGDGRAIPARVASSSAGHLLASRILDGDDAQGIRSALVGRLFEDDLLAGAGIRTRSTSSPRFRAGSYHNGSTWPMDTGVIIDGLLRHGFEREAIELEDRILRACAAIGGFPEFFRGDADGVIRVNVKTVDAIVDGVSNRLEQPPQSHQGWTTTRVWKILERRGEVGK